MSSVLGCCATKRQNAPQRHQPASGTSTSASQILRCIIDQSVAQVFGIASTDLKLATRGRARSAQARQVAMYLAHVACQLNYTDVGRLFDRDRTTVAHACAVVEDLRDDATFDRALELLEMVVQSMISGRAPIASWSALRESHRVTNA